MREITKYGNGGLRWSLTSALEDLNYADAIGVLFRKDKGM